MKQRRYTNEDIEKAYSSGMKKERILIIKDITEMSKEFIHPKLMNSFIIKLKNILNKD